jgi:hypothetical protein
MQDAHAAQYVPAYAYVPHPPYPPAALLLLRAARFGLLAAALSCILFLSPINADPLYCAANDVNLKRAIW